MTRDRRGVVLLAFVLVTVLVQLGTGGHVDVRFGRDPHTRYWTFPR